MPTKYSDFPFEKQHELLSKETNEKNLRLEARVDELVSRGYPEEYALIWAATEERSGERSENLPPADFISRAYQSIRQGF
jgi:hypothetical protein